MAISETNLGYVLHAQTSLRQRIEAIVQDKMWDGTTDPQRPVPVEALSWAVASTDSIRQTIRNWWTTPDGQPYEGNVPRSTDCITDAQLVTVINSALVRLNFAV